MKIKHISLLAVALLAMSACSDDTTDPVLELRQAATINDLATSNITITSSNATAQFPEITWEAANYGSGAVVNYVVTLTAANGRSAVIGETGECKLALTNAEMNAILAGLGAQPGVASDYTLSLVAQAFDAYTDPATNTVSFRATAYDPATVGIDWPFAYVAVGYPDWSFSNAYLIGDPDGDGVYQGYVQFDGAVNYALLDGANVATVLASSQQAPEAGFIEVTLADGAVTHSPATTWGLIGDATSGGWNSDTNMEYDPATRLWTAVTALTAKTFKFRANGGWDINYGLAAGGEEGALAPGGDNIAVAEDHAYIVTLNLTNAGRYTYTMEQTDIEQSSAFMTLPGSYQNWSADADDCYRITSEARDFKYSGTFYFEAGTEFKLYDGGTWYGVVGDLNWDSATNSAAFVIGDGANITVPVSSYLKITADTKKMTATMSKTGWEVIGDATPDGWDKGQVMDYDPTSGLWTITVTLTSGEIKFRWDGAWDRNLGGSLTALTQDGANIAVSAGTYEITLDDAAGTATMKAV